eukprot:CAMPEP_0182463852 /NCGR_PEP_ID=MMETSP1319-20130603/8017_1 /TAXON_ID=172717 /ORGANISM="Bolidomonas pacifica, Strain RCC208" /LENGTH=116 /DNA_ID=CAMNT_0024663441 /DNA_START=54 /DNA_END=400 /DNA_ORIENTATION=+
MKVLNRATLSIFSTPTCPSCNKLKALIAENVEGGVVNVIDLEAHPYRRPSLLSVTERFTVPQLFINNVFIGGLEEFQSYTGIPSGTPSGDMSVFAVPASSLPSYLSPADPSKAVPP